MKQAENKGTAIYSGRRDGLALYFARLVRPIWKANITKLGASGKHELGVPAKTLLFTQQNLFALKDFLDKNPHLFHSAASEPNSNRAPVADQEAWKVGISLFFSLCARLKRSFRLNIARYWNCKGSWLERLKPFPSSCF